MLGSFSVNIFATVIVINWPNWKKKYDLLLHYTLICRGSELSDVSLLRRMHNVEVVSLR